MALLLHKFSKLSYYTGEVLTVTESVRTVTQS